MCVMNFLWIPFVPPPPLLLLVFFCAGIKTSSTKDNSPDRRMMQRQLSGETNTKMVSISHQCRRNDAFSLALLFSAFFVSGLILNIFLKKKNKLKGLCRLVSLEGRMFYHRSSCSQAHREKHKLIACFKK